METKKEIFFLPENDKDIISLFDRKLEIVDCKEEGCEGLKRCIIKGGELEKFRKKGYAIGKEVNLPPEGFPEAKYPAIWIRNHPVHPKKIMISSRSKIDVVYHLGSKTTDEILGVARLEYNGTLRDAFFMYGTLESFPNPPLIIYREKLD